jgi:pyruvate/2-oxoglutarate dehydrogenase complex dihydrolipoamide acyltransferase (E2) component
MPLLDIVVPEDIGDIDSVWSTRFKRVGDPVERDSVLLILQAEKISFEVPAPATGQVAAILAEQGEVVKKGQLLARLEAEALPVVTPPPPPESRTEPALPAREVRASPIAKRLTREHNIDLAQVVGTGGEGRITEKDVLDFLAAQQAANGSKPAQPPRHDSRRPCPPVAGVLLASTTSTWPRWLVQAGGSSPKKMS